jgi:hypothetical protein
MITINIIFKINRSIIVGIIVVQNFNRNVIDIFTSPSTFTELVHVWVFTIESWETFITVFYCENPYMNQLCEGAWTCEDIYNISIEVLNYYDTNYDGSINLEDDIDPAHLEYLNDFCDMDANGQVDACEVH